MPSSSWGDLTPPPVSTFLRHDSHHVRRFDAQLPGPRSLLCALGCAARASPPAFCELGLTTGTVRMARGATKGNEVPCLSPCVGRAGSSENDIIMWLPPDPRARNVLTERASECPFGKSSQWSAVAAHPALRDPPGRVLRPRRDQSGSRAHARLGQIGPGCPPLLQSGSGMASKDVPECRAGAHGESRESRGVTGRTRIRGENACEVPGALSAQCYGYLLAVIFIVSQRNLVNQSSCEKCIPLKTSCPCPPPASSPSSPSSSTPSPAEGLLRAALDALRTSV